MARRAAINEVRPVLEEVDKVVDVVDKGLDAVEKGADVATDVVDRGVHVAVEEVRTAAHWLRSPKTAAIVVLAINVVGAGYVGWKLAKRHYTKKFEAELEREMEKARKLLLSKVDESGAIITPEKLAERRKEKAQDGEAEAAEALKEYQGSPVSPTTRPIRERVDYTRPKAKTEDGEAEATPEVVESNIFVDGRAFDSEVFDLAKEVAKRTKTEPYVISHDEFMANDEDHAQVSITYYAGDDVLVDDRDEPMDEKVVGIDNLMKFGYGSDDPNIVYIHNPVTKVDYEVAYSPGKYAVEVLGDEFIQHSDRPVHKRFRLRADE